ncbi:PH domain-containing protein [Streptomyces sp. NPDC059679]|uniref:PH domain-containing protein n=1 Tax=Streptomyces sp. NPDC059679 TaxID=3346903 RepID=UPI00367D80C3
MVGTREGRPRVREYRAPLWLWVIVMVFFGSFGVAVLGPASEEGMPVAAMVLAVSVVPLVFVLFVGFCLNRTVVDEDHVAVRRVFRTRRTAWRDIQGIEIEGDPAAVAEGRQPTGTVVVHHRDGRRIALPYLYDRPGLPVHQEVMAMRATWERRRGDDWTPLSEAEAAAAKAETEARTRRDRPWRQPGPGV